MKSERNIEKNVIKGAFLLTVSAIIVKILGLVYKIPLSYILSDEGMGYFNTAYTLFTFFYIICTAGVPKSISILISRLESKREYEKAELIYKTAFIGFVFIGILATLILFSFSGVFVSLVGNSKAYLSLLAISPSIAFVCASGVIRGYFSAYLKMLPIAVSEIISGAGKLLLGLLFAFISFKLNLPLYVISAMTIFGTTVGSFLGYLFLAVCYKRENKRQNTRQKKKFVFSLKALKVILAISIPLTLTSTVSALGNLLDMGFIMRGLQNFGFSEFQSGVIYGNYSTLAIPFVNLVGALIAPISAVILPVVTSLYTKGEWAGLNKQVNSALNFIGFISVPTFTVLFFGAGEILSIIFEDTSAILASPFLSLLAPSIVFTSLLTIINTVLEGMGKIRVPLISLIISLCVKILLNYILIGNSSLGMLGAPISASVSSAIGFLISYLYLTSKTKIKAGISSSLIFPLLVSTVAIIPYVRFISFGGNRGLFMTVVFLGIFAIIYFLFYAPYIFKAYFKKNNPSK